MTPPYISSDWVHQHYPAQAERTVLSECRARTGEAPDRSNDQGPFTSEVLPYAVGASSAATGHFRRGICFRVWRQGEDLTPEAAKTGCCQAAGRRHQQTLHAHPVSAGPC